MKMNLKQSKNTALRRQNQQLSVIINKPCTGHVLCSTVCKIAGSHIHGQLYESHDSHSRIIHKQGS